MARQRKRTLLIACLGIATVGMVLAAFGLEFRGRALRLSQSTLPMVGANPQHTGVVRVAVSSAVPDVLREIRPGVREGVFGFEPAIDDRGFVYAGCGARSGGELLISYDRAGAERWRYSAPDAFRYGLSAPLLLTEGLLLRRRSLVSGFRDGQVRSLDLDTGELRWATRLTPGAYVISSPVADRSGVIYIGGIGRNAVTKLAAEDGTVLWRHEIAERFGTSSPALSVDERTVYFSRGARRANDGYLYALNAATGQLRWRFVFPDSAFNFSSPVVGSDGTIYLQDSRDGSVHALADRENTCEELWSYATAGAGGAPRLLVVSGRALFFGINGDPASLTALSLDGKRRLWHREFPQGKTVGNPLLTANAVLVAVDDEGRVYALEPGTGETLWAKQVAAPGGEFASALGVDPDGVLYVGTNGTPSHPGECVLAVLSGR